MNPTTSLLIGVGLTVVFVTSWLGGIFYLRRTRHALAAQQTEEHTANLVRTEEQAHHGSIEEWLARAAALPEGQEPAGNGGHDQGRLRELAARHFPRLAEPHPHIHLIGVTGAEKRLVTWVCGHTGMPNPFDALDRLTGNPDELRRVTEAWQDAHADVLTVLDQLCTATATLHEQWREPRAEKVFAILADYLAELEDLAADFGATAETLRGLQAEAALAEATVVGLVNLLIGSLGGYFVETVLTAGTVTPAVAAQAQLELTWVLKQIARALSRLPGIYSNTRHILQSVTGFKGLDQMRERFQIAEVERIGRSLDAAS